LGLEINWTWRRRVGWVTGEKGQRCDTSTRAQRRFPRCSTHSQRPTALSSHLLRHPRDDCKSAVHSDSVVPTSIQLECVRRLSANDRGCTIHALCSKRPWGPALQRSRMWRLTQSFATCASLNLLDWCFWPRHFQSEFLKGHGTMGAEGHGSPSWTRRFQRVVSTVAGNGSSGVAASCIGSLERWAKINFDNVTGEGTRCWDELWDGPEDAGCVSLPTHPQNVRSPTFDTSAPCLNP
jgi:hypothetical protein